MVGDATFVFLFFFQSRRTRRAIDRTRSDLVEVPGCLPTSFLAVYAAVDVVVVIIFLCLRNYGKCGLGQKSGMSRCPFIPLWSSPDFNVLAAAGGRNVPPPPWAQVFLLGAGGYHLPQIMDLG